MEFVEFANGAVIQWAMHACMHVNIVGPAEPEPEPERMTNKWLKTGCI